MNILKQLIPSDVCLKCQICCRFPTPESDRIPTFLPEEKERLSPKERSLLSLPTVPLEGGGCRCPFFETTTHQCRIYGHRPLDCQLYPFLLLWNLTRSRVTLGLDTQCPFVQELAHTPELLAYAEEVKAFLEKEEQVRQLAQHSGIIGETAEEVLLLYPLHGLTEAFCNLRPPREKEFLEAGLHFLRLEDRPRLERYFGASGALSSHSFPSFFLFQDLYACYWLECHETLLLFAEQGGKSYLLLPPLGPNREMALEEAVALLQKLNGLDTPLQIENIPEEEVPFYEQKGFGVTPKGPEYIYRRDSLTTLRGNPYKSQRASCNYFMKHYFFSYLPYEAKDFNEGLLLFNRWADAKRKKIKDPYALSLLEDSCFVHHRILRHAASLGLEGRIVRIAGELKGYTFGFPLDQEHFCIVAEICEPEIKGLSQFLFREFCKELDPYSYINVMDDSGLESLRRVKESYRPHLKKAPYVAVEKRI